MRLFAFSIFSLLIVLSAQASPEGSKGEAVARPIYQPIEKWREDVLYGIIVDRFFDGNPSNNPPKVGSDLSKRQGGDLAGVIAKLDYLKNLGVSCLVLNPVVSSDAYHGYHPLNQFSLEYHSGKLEDYETLLEEAHKRGLKVLFDLVTNHVGAKSKLRKAHPDWFRDPKQEGTFRLDPPMTLREKNCATYFDLPDFIQEKEEVYQYIWSFTKFWIDKGIDGFRMDAVNLIAPSYWHRLNLEIKNYAGPNFFILGEEYDQDLSVLNAYVGEFDALYDFRTYYGLRNMYSSPYGNIAENLGFRWLQNPSDYRKPSIILSPFIDNHDVPRLISVLRAKGLSEELLRSEFEQALIFVMTQPGLPYVFYGTEIALEGPPQLKNDMYQAGRGLMRFENNEKHGAFTFIKKLIELRRKNEFGYATLTRMSAPPTILVYLLHVERVNRNFLVVHNFGDQHFSLQIPETGKRAEIPVKSIAGAEDMMTEEKISSKDEALVLELRPHYSRLISLPDRPLLEK